jgi:putative transposase
VKQEMLEAVHGQLSIREQCRIIALPRSRYYYKPQPIMLDMKIADEIDRIYTKRPYYGSRRIREEMRRLGYVIGRGRIRRYMHLMGYRAIYPRKSLSRPNKEHKVYPYLLRGVKVDHVNQVWGTDITFIPMSHGFVYLVVIMDWYSRCVLSWRLSTTLDADFCVEAINEALAAYGEPEIFNSDQGCQFTSRDFTEKLLARSICISMDGRGRAFDNIFVERLWRTVKYEEVYIKSYENVNECRASLRTYFEFYNQERVHQALGYATPAEVYLGRVALKVS